MNIPMSWLKEYVGIDCNIHDFVEEMTLSGSKVETVEYLGRDIKNVVIGKILKIEKHPDADKLVVCQVDVGQEEPVQIITGAPNVFEGAVIPVALHGATLAKGVKITKGKIRGQVSNGMMCSVEELGYTRHDYPEAPENGIYIFEQEQKPGSDPLEILEMRDEVVEFEITSNRPDCFSVIGIAREAAATFDKELKFPEIKLKEEARGDIASMISVEIKNPKLCPRYIARAVKNVKIGPSPQWMRHRLTAAGLRPINNIVDITNYVMLELGQPMHAFDIECIARGKIIVRNAEEGESFTTLDGAERKLDSSMLVISDPEKAVAIAGVMGGENSKISENATAVLFESANFNGPNVRVTAKKLGLRTDASAKYEKGLDPNLAEIAVNRALQLVELLGCGEVIKGMVDCYPAVREPWRVSYRSEGVNKLLGTDLSAEEMAKRLEKLEIRTENGEALIPTFRPDLEVEADIAEEVARIYGYDKIAATLAAGAATMGKKTDAQKIEDIIKEICVSLGLSEGLLYAFESPKVYARLQMDEADNVKILNPLGEDFSVMRTQTLNGILQSLATNYNRRNDSAGLFELGKVYIPKNGEQLPDEIPMLTIGFYGMGNFYDLKGMVEELFDVLGIKPSFAADAEVRSMHPGRTARVSAEGRDLGYLGEVHPAVLENYEIGAKVYLAVLNARDLTELARLKRVYSPLPKYPAGIRDIALLVNDDVFVADIEAVIRENGGKILEGLKLFDVYKGKQIAEGLKSVAYNLTFRAADRTLTEEEVLTSMNKIMNSLKSKLGAELRDK